MDRAELARRLQAAGAGQADGENLSATEDLLERLKKPSNRTDLSPLAVAADIYGKTGGAFQKMYKPPLSEEERLGAASKLEMALMKMQQSGNEKKLELMKTKRKGKDEEKLIKYGLIMRGNVRGATRVGRAWKSVETIERLKKYITEIDAGKITFDDVSNFDFSNAFSGLISGRAPGIELIRSTKYSYLGGKLRNLYEKASGRPQDALSPEMYHELKNMLGSLEKGFKHAMSKEQSHLYNVHKEILERNPAQLFKYRQMAGEWMDFDNRTGIAKEKRYDEPFEGIDPSYKGSKAPSSDSSSSRRKRIAALKAKRDAVLKAKKGE